MLLFWVFIFIVSLAVLVKGSDWLLESAEKIGLALGLSPFVVGVVIVGVGTSFPELISSLMAVLKGATEIVAANAIGSNIANILLVVGISAIVGKKLRVSKNLIDLDIPLLAISTMLFLGVAWDRVITLPESAILITTYIIHLLYTIGHKEEETVKKIEPMKVKSKTKYANTVKAEIVTRPKITFKDYILLIVGLAGLIIGAKYLIDSVIKLSEILNIAAGVISLAAVAFGTSLPELLVSIKAAMRGKAEMALGNIFGSNIFNILMVVGIPGLFSTLRIDEQTYVLAIPVLIATTFLFIVSGISKTIYIWEGAMYLIVYIFFMGKLFNFI
ncbi:calcium/sodium antiporter [Patescibacteria group bacterium]|nr:calcium/sodium antiporter [Patescibacteria group bacterium]